MGRLSKTKSMMGRFLLFTLPFMAICTAVYIGALVWFQVTSIREQEEKITRDTAQRYAAVLAKPIWNLEEESIANLMETLVREPDTICIFIREMGGTNSNDNRGVCDKHEVQNTISAEQEIVYKKGKVGGTIGKLVVVREFKGTPQAILISITPQLALAGFIAFGLILASAFGFRHSVIRPLGRIHRSLEEYEATGKRRQVEWESSDELGQFVQAFNTSLEQQEKSERAQKQSEENLIRILDNSPFGVSIAAIENRKPIYCNKRFRDMMGLADDIPITVDVIVASYEFPEEMPELWSDFEKKRELRGIEQRRVRTNGEKWCCLADWRMLDFFGEQVAMIWYYDITSRKEAENEMVLARRTAETALADLQQAQKQLVETEKMAALGNLVAGVAHEINTPLGVAITVNSHNREKASQIQKMFDDGTLTTSAFQKFVHDVQEGEGIISDSLEKAADLVRSFKMVSVDQHVEELREINITEYVDNILTSMKSQFKGTEIDITLGGTSTNMINVFPGIIAQIISNLLINSYIHGFSNGEKEGHIDITINDQGDNVIVHYKDDGVGFSQEISEKIFDPFYTTNRKDGGTGLGMHIVYNLVTQKLKGEIRHGSEEGKGCWFEMKFRSLA